MSAESHEMEVSHLLTHRRTHRVRGPRPFSWISSSSDSSPNEYWPWIIRSSSLSRMATQRSFSPDSSISSSSSHTTHTADSSVGYSETRRRRRRKPAGPRAPRDSACFEVQRVGPVVNTSPSVIPRCQREDSPIIRGPTRIDSMDMCQFSPTPTSVHSPSSFPLDWDAIFELLGCSDTGTEGGW